MRTTVDIDDDVLHAVREIARQRKLATGKVISGLLRQALTERTADGRDDEEAPNGVAGFRPFTGRHTPVTNDRTDRLRDEEGV